MLNKRVSLTFNLRCVFILTPLIFIGWSPEQQLKLAEPTLETSEEQPCGKVEAVGPMGLVGRPAHCANRPQLSLVGCPGLPYPNPWFKALF
jgi:hypothetical protein